MANRIFGVSMVKNEEDIIEDFVRHNTNYLDELHIIVQSSKDDTLGILEKLKRDGFNILIVLDSDDTFNQGEKLSKYSKSLLQDDDCVIVVLLDADEFIKSQSPAIFRETVLSIPNDGFGLLHWDSYVPTEVDVVPGKSNLVSITHRLKTETRITYKVILTKKFLDPSLYIPMGAHRVYSADSEINIKAFHFNNISLAHFPVRSVEQLFSKARNGVAQLNREKRPITEGYHWRVIFSLFNQGSLDFDILQKIAADYQFSNNFILSSQLPELIYDALPCAYQLIYTKY